jgi:hypothetical protein
MASLEVQLHMINLFLLIRSRSRHMNKLVLEYLFFLFGVVCNRMEVIRLHRPMETLEACSV